MYVCCCCVLRIKLDLFCFFGFMCCFVVCVGFFWRWPALASISLRHTYCCLAFVEMHYPCSISCCVYMQSQALVKSAVLHFFEASKAAIPLAPNKHHQLLHLAIDSFRMGNPRLYANWLDESLNQDLRNIAQNAHSLVFEERVFSHWLASQGRLTSSRERKRERPRSTET